MQNNSNLTIQDLATMIDIINIASSRNAFRAEEFLSIGLLYQKLIDIVQKTGAVNNNQNMQEQPKESPKND